MATVDSVLQDVVDKIPGGVDATVGGLWPILVSLAAVGLLSYAILEMIKVFPVRRGVNWLFVRTWLKKSKAVAPSAEADVALLAAAGEKWVMYSLPAEKLAGQINAAAQIALAYPQKYRTIIVALSQGAIADDLTIVTTGNLATGGPAPADVFAAARTRVGNMIQRNLDMLQIRIDTYWTLGNQIAAVVISSVLISTYIQVNPFVDWPTNVKWLVVAILGGMIAPFAKDMIAALKSVRDRAK